MYNTFEFSNGFAAFPVNSICSKIIYQFADIHIRQCDDMASAYVELCERYSLRLLASKPWEKVTLPRFDDFVKKQVFVEYESLRYPAHYRVFSGIGRDYVIIMTKVEYVEQLLSMYPNTMIDEQDGIQGAQDFITQYFRKTVAPLSAYIESMFVMPVLPINELFRFDINEIIRNMFSPIPQDLPFIVPPNLELPRLAGGEANVNVKH